MISTWGAIKPLASMVRDVLNKFGTGAHRYLAGVGSPGGFVAGNYQDSAGTTQAVVDQPVGLVLDAAGSVGSELFAGSYSIFAAATGNGTVSNGASSSTAICTVAGVFGTKPVGLTTTTGKTYQHTVSWSGNTNGRSLGIDFGSASISLGTAASGSITYRPFCATGGTIAYYATNGQVGDSITFSAVSVKEVTGIHASQSTAGYKPVMRRGVVNLLLQSQFQDGLVSTPTNGGLISVSSLSGYAGALAFGWNGSATTYAYKSFTALANTNYTMAAVVRMDDGNAPSFGSASLNGSANSFCLVSQGDGLDPTAYTTANLGGGYYLVCSAAYQKVTPGSLFGIVKYSTNDNRTLKAGSYGLFQGTLTAAQILAYGGIPLTTTSAASSSFGPYWHEYVAASGRYLSLGSVPFQATDDFALTCSVKLASSGAVKTVFALSDATTAKYIWLYFNASGNLVAKLSDGTNTATVTSSSAYVGAAIVATVQKVGSTLSLSINSVSQGTASTSAVNSFTSTIAWIGYYTGGAFALDGAIYDVIPVKGTLTLADIKTLEKAAAQSAGITL